MINATIPSTKADLTSRSLRHRGDVSCKHDVLVLHKLNFLFLFWPSLIPRYEKFISAVHRGTPKDLAVRYAGS